LNKFSSKFPLLLAIGRRRQSANGSSKFPLLLEIGRRRQSAAAGNQPPPAIGRHPGNQLPPAAPSPSNQKVFKLSLFLFLLPYLVYGGIYLVNINLI